MSLESGVRKDEERGVYVYYVVHDGAEIPFMERKAGGVEKRLRAAQQRQQQEQQPQGEQV